MPKPETLRVFLSYDTEDREVAHKIAHALGKAGYDVFPGDDWPKSIDAALKRANAMVVFVSSNSMKSPWVLKEMNYALASPDYSNRVMPVFVKGMTQVPW